MKSRFFVANWLSYIVERIGSMFGRQLSRMFGRQTIYVYDSSFLMHLFFWRLANMIEYCKVWFAFKEVGSVACSFSVGKLRL